MLCFFHTAALQFALEKKKQKITQPPNFEQRKRETTWWLIQLVLSSSAASNVDSLTTMNAIRHLFFLHSFSTHFYMFIRINAYFDSIHNISVERCMNALWFLKPEMKQYEMNLSVKLKEVIAMQVFFFHLSYLCILFLVWSWFGVIKAMHPPGPGHFKQQSRVVMLDLQPACGWIKFVLSLWWRYLILFVLVKHNCAFQINLHGMGLIMNIILSPLLF